jgi:hypothetical protein
MSSYSYFLIPTASNDPRMTTAKRQTLADFLYFSVCQGQKEMGPIGYSPLPINLVQASFAQTNKLKAADPNVDLTKRDVTTCQNPTFVAGHPEINHLAKIAPPPSACDKSGAGPCNPDGSSPTVGSNGGSNGNSNGGGSGTGNGTNGTGTTGTGTTGSHTGASGGATSGATKAPGGTKINPDTGQVISTGGDVASGDVSGVPVDLADYRQQNMTGILAPLAVAELIAVIVLPPAIYYFVLTRRRRRS